MSWYNSSWKYRVKITIDHSKVGSDLTDFPVYVDLSTLPSGFHTNVKSDGGDIRVTRSDGTTECPREVVFYNSTADTGELYFKANSVSSSTDTDFYVYYGNSTASDYATNATYGAENVWNSSYKGVWHMSETSGTVYDSTSNSNDSTGVTLTTQGSASSKFGTASDFDGTDDRIEFGDILDLGTNDMTISAWVYLDSTGANDFIVSKAKAAGQKYRYGIGVLNTSHYFRAFCYGDSGSDVLPVCSTSVQGGWHKIDATFDRSGNLTVYTDAGDASSAAISQWSSSDFQSDNPFRIGSYTASDNTSTLNEFNGRIDEVRLSWDVKSVDWISAEYANQSSPTTFYTVGTQEANSTEANSVRSLYIFGKNTDNSNRGLYTYGSLNSNSTRGLYLQSGEGANSTRDLYVEVVGTGNSVRGLYLLGSQVLSTDYFNVVFSEPSISASGERGLYVSGYGTDLSERRLYITGSTSGSGDRTLYVCGLISNGSERSLYLQGSLSSNSERGLLLEGKPVIDERGLYLLGYIYTSSTRDLYLGGIDTGTSERNLYTQGTSSSTSNRSFYIQGSISTNNERGLYLIGKSLEGERGLYLHGFETGSSEKKLYLEGANVGYDNRGLYIQGYLSDSSSRGLYLYGYGVGTPERALHIAGVGLGASERGVCVEGKDIDVSERGLYIQGSLEDGSNRKLYLEGYISANIERTLYIQGQETLNSSMPLYIWGYEVGSFERNLYIQGYDIKSSSRGLYIQGYLSDNSDRELYLFGYDIETSERGLYLVGLDLETSERSIYLEGKDMGASERDLYVHGFVRSFSNRGLYIVGDGEVPFHEGNVIIKIDEGLYLNPKTGRIYVAIE